MIHQYTAILAAALVALGAPAALSSQTPEALQAGVRLRTGDRVRVSAPGWPGVGGRVVGAITALDKDTLRVRSEKGGAVVALPLWAVERLDVYTGRTTRATNALIGAGAGAAVGAVFGGALGAATCKAGDDGFGGDCRTRRKRTEFILAGAALLGAPAAALGALLGVGVPREHWRQAEAPFRLSIGPTSNGRGAWLQVVAPIGGSRRTH